MGFVPVEKVIGKVENKYEAVLIAAREARLQNSIAQLEDRDPNEVFPKVTTVALQNLIANKVRYYYGNEPPPPAVEDGDEVLDLEEADAADE